MLSQGRARSGDQVIITRAAIDAMDGITGQEAIAHLQKIFTWLDPIAAAGFVQLGQAANARGLAMQITANELAIGDAPTGLTSFPTAQEATVYVNIIRP